MSCWLLPLSSRGRTAARSLRTERKIVKTSPAKDKSCVLENCCSIPKQSADVLLLLPSWTSCDVIFRRHVFVLPVHISRRRRKVDAEAKRANRRGKRGKVQFPILSLSPLSTSYPRRAVICLLKICNFWNYYFICIVWEPPCFACCAPLPRSDSLSRLCDRLDISNLTNHLEYFISINIGGEYLSYRVCSLSFSFRVQCRSFGLDCGFSVVHRKSSFEVIIVNW